MKFRNGVFIFIVAVILTAWWTKPGYKDFMKFQSKQPRPASPPHVEFTNGFLFSRVKVTYFMSQVVPLKTEGDKKEEVAVPQTQASYLGLFGRFWALD